MGVTSARLQIEHRLDPNQMAHVAIPMARVFRVVFSSGSEHVPWVIGSRLKFRGGCFCHGGC